MRTRDLQIVRIDGTSAPTDNACLSLDLNPLTDLILYLYFVFIRQNDDARVALIFISRHEFVEDGEDLRRPTQHKRVIVFEHFRTPLAEPIHLVFDPIAQDTDQCTDDKDASQSHKQHYQAEARACIA